MRVDDNYGGTLGYEPNDQREWAEQPGFSEPPLPIEGPAAHWNHRDDPDYYSQPGALFRLMGPEKQKILFENTARSLAVVPREIQLRHIRNCHRADPAYGKGVAEALGLAVSPAELAETA
jgi:catalase